MKNIKLEFSSKFIIIRFEDEVTCLSSAPYNGGLVKTSCLLNYKVPKSFNCENPEIQIRKFLEELSLPENTVAFITAADLNKYSSMEYKDSSLELFVLSTVGLSNARSIGEKPYKLIPSTINTFVIVDRKLAQAAMVNAISTITEAKSLAMFVLDIRSVTNRDIAIGTSTDAIAMVSLGKGNELKYAGTATEVGSAISNLVFQCVIKGALNEVGFSLMRRLKERGITFEELYSAAKEGIVGKIPKDFKKKFKDELIKFAEDPNVCSLLIASMRLEDEAKRGIIPNLSIEEYKNDSSKIIVDEVIGEAIANYIAGTKGVNNFRYYDMLKPGIISKLPMFTDDAICGLIAGIMARIFEKENEQNY